MIKKNNLIKKKELRKTKKSPVSNKDKKSDSITILDQKIKSKDKVLSDQSSDKTLVPSIKEEIADIKRKIVPSQDIKVSISESKIIKLLDISHINELFYLVSILEDKQIASFLDHYKKSTDILVKDEKMDRLIKNSKTKHELLENLKKEITNRLKDEYLDLRSKISVLRKKGIDVYIEDITSLNIQFKIRMFNATSKKDDYYKVKKMLESINAEILLKTPKKL